jgi:glycosyltransferase involved in cell wall biosynthesis
MILCVGVLQARKNILRLIEAFEQVDTDWKLTLAGAANGYGAQAILDRIAASRANGRIRITGYVSEDVLADLYSRAAIFAFPSLDEGFGIPVLEAMAHGIPVLTSNRSALPEVAGESALLVNPESTEEIRDALLRLMHDSGLRTLLAGKGRLRAQCFTWERAAHATYGAYSDLLRG